MLMFGKEGSKNQNPKDSLMVKFQLMAFFFFFFSVWGTSFFFFLIFNFILFLNFT